MDFGGTFSQHFSIVAQESNFEGLLFLLFIDLLKESNSLSTLKGCRKFLLYANHKIYRKISTPPGQSTFSKY